MNHEQFVTKELKVILYIMIYSKTRIHWASGLWKPQWRTTPGGHMMSSRSVLPTISLIRARQMVWFCSVLFATPGGECSELGTRESLW